MEPTRFIVEEDVHDGRETILARLVEFNDRFAPSNLRPLGILLKNEKGSTVCGLWGRSVYGWLFIEFLFVPEELRGQGLGTSLLHQAEEIARSRGCIGVWLDTFSFQALGFYQKLGYTVFGELQDYPVGHSSLWLQKRLDRSSPQRTTIAP